MRNLARVISSVSVFLPLFFLAVTSVSCLNNAAQTPSIAPSNVSTSSFSHDTSQLLSRVQGEDSGENGEEKVAGERNQQSFSLLSNELVSRDEPTHAELSVRFNDDKPFPLNGLQLAMNGMKGTHEGDFDLRSVSQWLEEGGHWNLHIKVSQLDFGERGRFFEKIRDIQSHSGQVAFSFSYPKRVQFCELSFWKGDDDDEDGDGDHDRNRFFRSPRPNVIIDSGPVGPIPVRTATFTFHSPHHSHHFQCSLDRAPYADCSSPEVYSSLNNGIHVFKVRAVSLFHTFGHPAFRRFVVDAPEADVQITSTSPSQFPTNIQTMSIAFAPTTTTPPGKGFSCQLDSGTASPCSSPVVFQTLNEGTHTVSIVRTGLPWPSLPATFSWNVDLTPPLQQWISTPPSITNSTTAAFAFEANESSHFLCTLDSNAPQSCASPYSVQNLADGTHVLNIVATDLAGNTSQPLTYQWTVDTTPPVLFLVGTSPSQTPTNSTALALSYTVSEPSTPTCSLDDSPLPSCQSPIQVSGLEDGTHILQITAQDNAGNLSSPLTYQWQIDTITPLLSVTMLAPTALPTNSTSAQFSFQASDTTPLSFLCSLDNNPSAACSSPLSLSSLTEGTHTLTVQAFDLAGNESSPITSQWQIDLTPPTISLTDPSQNGAILATNSVSIGFTTSEIASTTCNLDSSGATACQSPYVANSLATGTHSLIVQATDPAGNVSAPLTVTWQVAPTAYVTIQQTTPAATLTNLTTMSIPFSSSTTSSFECSLDGAAFSPCSSPMTYAGLANQAHTFHVEGINAAGVAGPQASFSWTVDTNPPTITLGTATPPDAITIATSISLPFTVSEQTTTTSTLDNAITTTCALDNASPTPCSSPFSATQLTSGTHSITILATDAAGNSASASYQWKIAAPAVATILTVSPSASPTNQTSITIAFSGTGATGFTCSLDGSAFTPCTSPFAKSGLIDGTHSFEVEAINSAGQPGAAVSYLWNIDTTPPAVALTAETPAYSPTSQTSLRISFSASEAATFHCGLDGGLTVPCTSPYSVSNLSDGSHTLSVTATDAAGNVSVPVSYQWLVNTAPLTISGISASQVTATSAVISWTTNVPASSQVFYGIGNTGQTTLEDPGLSTIHSVLITGLSANSLYEAQAASTDADGRNAVSPVMSFRTPR